MHITSSARRVHRTSGSVLAPMVLLLAVGVVAASSPAPAAGTGHAATAGMKPEAIQELIDEAFALQEDGGTLADVREALDVLADEPAGVHARGTVEFLEAIEWLLQGANRHGFLMPIGQAGRMLPREARILEWNANDQPAATTPQLIDMGLRGFLARLAIAESTLAGVDGDFSCAIELPAIRFDLDGDGTAASAEGLRALFALLPERRAWDPEQRRTVTGPLVPQDLVVAFDRGDTAWLRGYCHLMSAVTEVILAHDYRDWFDRTGFVLFPKAVTTHGQLPGTSWSMERIIGMQAPVPFDLTDVIAMFGNLRLPVDEPARLRSALEHLRRTTALGREMWEAYDAETDDDREWIPNPDQTAAFHDVTVDRELRDGWLALIEEADAVLHGRKLLRYWRGDGSQGIDLVKVMEEPQEFDLLYWIQGSAATPYLREGEYTAPGTWAQIRRVTDQRIFRFSFWFN